MDICVFEDWGESIEKKIRFIPFNELEWLSPPPQRAENWEWSKDRLDN